MPAEDTIPPELLAPPSPRERRHLDRDGCAALLDGALRRLAHADARGRLLLGRLAARLLARRGHHALGFVRLADYARERLGLSGRELQELARVARGLEALPAIADALGRGQVSWSQARLLVSLATPETEREWLARARPLSVRALATTARHDPDEHAPADGEPRARFHLRCPRAVRRLWLHTAELASRMAGAHLPAWRAMAAVLAEGLAAGAPAESPAPAHAARPPAPLPAPLWEELRDVLPDPVAHLAVGVDLLCDPHRLDDRLRATVRALQRLDWQTGRLLALFADLRLGRALGFSSLESYVRERLGCSVRRARALVALDRRARALPALAEAYRDGRLSFARALALLPVVAPETVAAWVERAQQVTVRRLGDLVDWALEVQEPDVPLLPPPAEGPLVLPPLADVQTCARGMDAEISFAGPVSVVGLLWATLDGLTPAGRPRWQGLAALLLHAKAEWERQPRHRDPIFARDGWRCAVPACTSRASLHDHHVVYRSRGGDHRRDNRVAICAAHHLRGIHGLRIRVTGQAPDDLTWELGWRRARPPLFRTHGDRYVDG
jgi:hypothetical protein